MFEVCDIGDLATLEYGRLTRGRTVLYIVQDVDTVSVLNLDIYEAS